ncbi:MAG: hypothetical protein JOZ05_18720, partial [Acetobacteraceae bacterium]|nr:hypothetical protein [Acetobacteraceae bacterium]
LLGWQADLPRLMGIVVNHLLSPFNFEFCAGLLAAVLFRRITGGASLALVLVVAGVATIGWRMGLDGWGVDYGPAAARLVYGAGYASVLLGLSMLERSGTVPFRGRWGRFAVAAGAVSYPLYLCHLLVIDALADRLVAAGVAPWLGADAVFALFLSISVLVATGLAYLVDRPIQAVLRALRFSAGSRSLPAEGV